MEWPTSVVRFPLSQAIEVQVEELSKLRASLRDGQEVRWGSLLESITGAGRALVDAGPDADPCAQREWLEEAEATWTVLCCEAHMGELIERRMARALTG